MHLACWLQAQVVQGEAREPEAQGVAKSTLALPLATPRQPWPLLWPPMQLKEQACCLEAWAWEWQEPSTLQLELQLGVQVQLEACTQLAL